MIKMIETILFDVDGTLIDTTDVMINSLKMTLKEIKSIVISDNRELNFILGITGEKAIEKFASSDDEKKILLNNWAKNIEALSYQESVFSGIKEMLKKLKTYGYTTGIVTSKNQHEMESEFNRFKLNSYFDCIVNSSDTKMHKPNAAPINLALNILNKPKSTALYVGDSPYDLKTARNSGIKFAWAQWGSVAVISDFKDADIFLAKPSSLMEFLYQSS